MKKSSKKRESAFDSFNPLENKTVLLGITGGIAAYKACDIASMLRRSGADVHAILTPNAKEFITPFHSPQ